MKPIKSLFEQITDDYSIIILNWAIKKTGNRPDGEDLAQEVLYQILSFVNGKTKIEKLDNLIWKIAHYTWCNRIRRIKKDADIISLDGSNNIYITEERDYINEFIDNEELKNKFEILKRKISDLSKTQREIIIAYYLENLSVSDIASKSGVNKSAVKWHLFDARKKIKENFNVNNNLNIIKPGRLSLGTSGQVSPGGSDTRRINESLTKQNICLLCYSKNGKSINELSEITGIPKPYLEYDLDWLVDREFLIFENKKYITNFGIIDARHAVEIRDIYIKSKENYYQKIIDYINSHEQDIRNIGFHGCDFDWNKLLWSVLTLYLRYFSESEPLKTLKKSDEYDLRKDGGRYFINAFDVSDNQLLNVKSILSEPVSNPEKWQGINGIWCNWSESVSEFRSNGKLEDFYATYWLGIYIFSGNSSTITKNIDAQKIWRKILSDLSNNNFSISGMHDDEKELIATAVKENIIKKDGEKYMPMFTIFTVEQFRRLYSEIFEPLVKSIKPETLKLIETFRELNTRRLPRNIANYTTKWTYFDMWDSGIKNFMFAADDGYLYMPETPEDGTSLTLSFIY